MVKGGMTLNIMCNECCFLDRSRKQESSNPVRCYRYGCNAIEKEKYICGWITNDKELKTMGCSYCNRLVAGTVFLLRNTRCIYCGKIGNKYLVYNASTYVQNGYIVDAVEKDFIRKHLKEITFISRTDKTKELALYYKKQYIRRNKNV